MTGRLSRRSLLGVAAGGLALAALPVRPASAASDDELAYANFGLAAAYLAADFYGKALEADELGAGARRMLRRGRTAANLHARALSDLITGAGDTPATAEDFEFAWPGTAFATASNIRKTGLAILRGVLGAYQSAVASVSEPSYRVLYTSLVASVSEQIGQLAAPGADEGLHPFPVALDLEAASAALEGYLG
jgi:hypothetical protein